MRKGIVYLVYDRPDILEYQEISKSKVKEAGYDVCLISNFSLDKKKFKYDHYQEVDLPFGNNKNIAFLLDYLLLIFLCMLTQMYTYMVTQNLHFKNVNNTKCV